MDLYTEGKYSSALKMLLENTPLDNYLIGMCYYYLKDYIKCLEYLSKVDTPESYLYQGHSLINIKKFTSAIIEYNKIPDDHKLAMTANYNCALCYEKLNQSTNTIASLRKALSLKNDDILMYQKVKNRLVYTLLDKHIDAMDLFNSNINEVNDLGQLLLVLAVIHEDIFLISDLLKLGADPFKEDDFKRSAFGEAITFFRDDDIRGDKYMTIQLLRKHLKDKHQHLLKESESWRDFYLYLKKFHSKGKFNDEIFQKVKPFAVKYFEDENLNFETDYLGKQFSKIDITKKDADITLINGTVVSLNELIESYLDKI